MNDFERQLHCDFMKRHATADHLIFTNKRKHVVAAVYIHPLARDAAEREQILSMLATLGCASQSTRSMQQKDLG